MRKALAVVVCVIAALGTVSVIEGPAQARHDTNWPCSEC